jgi:hypothetical protein
VEDINLSKSDKVICILVAGVALLGIVLAALGHATLGATVVAFATMAAILYQSILTRRSVDIAGAETEASVKMLGEVQQDRDLSVQPFIAIGPGPSPITTDVAGSGKPGVRLRNVGRGPAIGLRVMQWHAGQIFWSEGLVTVPSGDHLPYVPPTQGNEPSSHLMLSGGGEGASQVDPSFVQREKPNDLCVYCLDQLGNGLRFRVRTSEPPETWHRGDPEPPWAPALKEPLDWRLPDIRKLRPM